MIRFKHFLEKNCGAKYLSLFTDKYPYTIYNNTSVWIGIPLLAFAVDRIKQALSAHANHRLVCADVRDSWNDFIRLSDYRKEFRVWKYLASSNRLKTVNKTRVGNFLIGTRVGWLINEDGIIGSEFGQCTFGSSPFYFNNPCMRNIDRYDYRAYFCEAYIVLRSDWSPKLI